MKYLNFRSVKGIFAVTILISSSNAFARDTARGKMLFGQRCAVCHSNDSGGRATAGPNLYGVVGRKAGSTEYNYSSALKKSTIIWSRETLESYLASPSKLVTGTKMFIAVPSAADRSDIVDFLSAQ